MRPVVLPDKLLIDFFSPVSPYAPPRPSAPTPGSGPRGGQFVPGKKMAAPTFATAAGKTAREHWLSALRADRGRGLSSEGTKASTWMGGKPESATSATAVTSYLKDLMTVLYVELYIWANRDFILVEEQRFHGEIDAANKNQECSWYV